MGLAGRWGSFWRQRPWIGSPSLGLPGRGQAQPQGSLAGLIQAQAWNQGRRSA